MRGRYLRQLMREVSSKLHRPSIVLLYHRVADIAVDPWSLAVTPRHFAEHMEVIEKHGGATRLPDLVDDLRQNHRPRKRIALTFDDGYVDNYTVAAPMLERHEIPATFFITTGGVAKQEEFWWDQLASMLLEVSGAGCEGFAVESESAEYALTLPANSQDSLTKRSWRAWDQPLSEQHAIYVRLYERLQPQTDIERQQTLTQLRTSSGTVQYGHADYRRMTPSQICSLSDHSLFDIGAHTVTHPFLASRPGAEQRAEILESRRFLENLTGRRIPLFAYPFGRRGDYTQETVEIVREAGFECACSNFAGRITPRTDLFQLPRIYVDDWDGDEFDRQLSRWLHV